MVLSFNLTRPKTQLAPAVDHVEQLPQSGTR